MIWLVIASGRTWWGIIFTLMQQVATGRNLSIICLEHQRTELQFQCIHNCCTFPWIWYLYHKSTLEFLHRPLPLFASHEANWPRLTSRLNHWKMGMWRFTNLVMKTRLVTRTEVQRQDKNWLWSFLVIFIYMTTWTPIINVWIRSLR